MMEQVRLTIDGREVVVPAGSTLLQAAEAAGVDIPVLCYFAHTTSNGLCRLCVVELGGRIAAFKQPASPRRGQMRWFTRARKRCVRARRTILEMLASTVDLSESPELGRLLADYQAHPERFAGGETRQPPLMDDNPMYIRDYSKCVLCWRCVQVCAEDAQYTYAHQLHWTRVSYIDRDILRQTHDADDLRLLWPVRRRLPNRSTEGKARVPA